MTTPRALCCAIAGSIALIACVGSDPEESNEEGIKVRKELLASCDGGVWQLAPYFKLARDVDYIADRASAEMPIDKPLPQRVISEHGEACATATDRERCQAAVERPVLRGRHLLTTEGDQVRLWEGDAVKTLFGWIDTPEEAIWIASNFGYEIGCDSKFEVVNAAFMFEVSRPDAFCPDGSPVVSDVRVVLRGDVEEVGHDCAGFKR